MNAVVENLIPADLTHSPLHRAIGPIVFRRQTIVTGNEGFVDNRIPLRLSWDGKPGLDRTVISGLELDSSLNCPDIGLFCRHERKAQPGDFEPADTDPDQGQQQRQNLDMYAPQSRTS